MDVSNIFKLSETSKKLWYIQKSMYRLFLILDADRVHFAITIQYNSLWLSTLSAWNTRNYLIVLHAKFISHAGNPGSNPGGITI